MHVAGWLADWFDVLWKKQWLPLPAYLVTFPVFVVVVAVPCATDCGIPGMSRAGGNSLRVCPDTV